MRKAIKNAIQDQRRYSRTAVKTKKINISPKVSRGGTRM